jgi:hypothetical protein
MANSKQTPKSKTSANQKEDDHQRVSTKSKTVTEEHFKSPDGLRYRDVEGTSWMMIGWADDTKSDQIWAKVTLHEGVSSLDYRYDPEVYCEQCNVGAVREWANWLKNYSENAKVLRMKEVYHRLPMPSSVAKEKNKIDEMKQEHSTPTIKRPRPGDTDTMDADANGGAKRQRLEKDRAPNMKPCKAMAIEELLDWPKEPTPSRMKFLAKVIFQDNLGFRKAPPVERLRQMREWRGAVKRTIPLNLCPAILEWQEESGQHPSQMTPKKDEEPLDYLNAALLSMLPEYEHLITPQDLGPFQESFADIESRVAKMDFNTKEEDFDPEVREALAMLDEIVQMAREL